MNVKAISYVVTISAILVKIFGFFWIWTFILCCLVTVSGFLIAFLTHSSDEEVDKLQTDELTNPLEDAPMEKLGIQCKYKTFWTKFNFCLNFYVFYFLCAFLNFHFTTKYQ